MYVYQESVGVGGEKLSLTRREQETKLNKQLRSKEKEYRGHIVNRDRGTSKRGASLAYSPSIYKSSFIRKIHRHKFPKKRKKMPKFILQITKKKCLEIKINIYIYIYLYYIKIKLGFISKICKKLTLRERKDSII